MKTKKEIWRSNGLNPDNFSAAVSEAMDEYATQQLEAEREKHDQEMVEFAEYCAQLHIRLNYVWCHKYGDQTDKRNYIETPELLTKFRESKQQ